MSDTNERNVDSFKIHYNPTFITAATDSRICFYDTSHGNVLNRLHLQKRIMQLLRKIEHCIHGVQPAWEETFR